MEHQDLPIPGRVGWRVPPFSQSIWAQRRHTWCVVIPVINEGVRIQALLKGMHGLKIHDLADVLIVDGGTTDGSLDPEFLQRNEVRGVLTKLGPGKLSAQLRCAYAFALDEGYKGIVTIDGNNKDDPEAIPRFIAQLQAGYDFVQASRYLPGGAAENTPKIRDLAIRLIHAPALSVSSGFAWTDTTQGFRGYSRRLLLDPRVAPFRDVFENYELLAYLSHRAPGLGYRCVEIATARRYPKGEVPTKIAGMRGNMALLKVLWRACTGRYNPDQAA